MTLRVCILFIFRRHVIKIGNTEGADDLIEFEIYKERISKLREELIEVGVSL